MPPASEHAPLSADEPALERDAPVPTWFGVGGRADALARPHSLESLRAVLRRAHNDGETVRVFGEGANLLVDDEGVDGLVVSLEYLDQVEAIDGKDPGLLRVGAGVNLPRLIVETVRSGLEGLETLAGVPATIGGALVMNAGGRFGEISSVMERVYGLAPNGQGITILRNAIDFGYRRSGLNGLIITGADLRLRPSDDPAALRERLKDVMAAKKASQPMAERSAGCVFKNPVMPGGERESAGRLIDQAGLKGLRIGRASVSPVHANFVVVEHRPGETTGARDVIRLMREVQRRVLDAHGVELEPEVVVWTRGGTPWQSLAGEETR